MLQTRFFRFAQKILYFLAFFAIIFVFLPVDYWLMVPLEESYPVPSAEILDKFDGVIVLGGETHTNLSNQYNMPIVPFGAERLNKFIELYHKNPKARFVFTGGDLGVDNQEKNEAFYSKMYIENLCIDTSNMIFENKSRNTLENVILSKELVLPRLDEKWILITSAYHMRRSIHYFKRSNWDVVPYPVGFRRVKSLNPFEHPITTKLQIVTTAIKEWIGLLAAYIF
ncbi:MAG: YdcF family protein [Alphaproteobacteria bacterium]|nr:YdcF family protein [Alphaproteobacteria bacterium]